MQELVCLPVQVTKRDDALTSLWVEVPLANLRLPYRNATRFGYGTISFPA